MATFNDKHTTPAEVLQREAEAARELESALAESRSRLAPRCPDCGAIGTLEEVDGVTRCIECGGQGLVWTRQMDAPPRPKPPAPIPDWAISPWPTHTPVRSR